MFNISTSLTDVFYFTKYNDYFIKVILMCNGFIAFSFKLIN